MGDKYRGDPNDDSDYFTVVFKGNLARVLGNPFKTMTPFGYPVSVGYGDALQKLDDMECEIERAADDAREMDTRA